MTNKEMINAMVAQWESEHADAWAKYEIGCEKQPIKKLKKFLKKL